MMTSILVLAAAAVVQVVLFTVSTWWLVTLVGGQATEVAFGQPRVVKWRWRDIVFSIGPILNGSVAILGRGVDEPISDPRDWRRLALGKRLLVLGAPWLLAFAIAAGCIGVSHTLRSLVHGFYQLLFVFDLTPLVRRMFAIAATKPVHVTLGILFAKYIAINLVPLPGCAGGGMLLEIVGRVRVRWMLIGMLVSWFVTLRVLVAILRVLMG